MLLESNTKAWKCLRKEKHVNIHYSSYFHILRKSFVRTSGFRNGNKYYSLPHSESHITWGGDQGREGVFFFSEPQG